MNEATTEKILQGSLGEPWAGPCIGFEAGEFVLFAGNSLGEGEVLARHESWRQFVALVGEYHSDYAGEDA